MRKLLAVKISIITAMLLLVVACGGKKDDVPANALTATPSKIEWGGILTGQTSDVKKVWITNTSDVDITDIKYKLRNNQTKVFLSGSSCSSTLPAKGTCSIDLSFKPDADSRTYTDYYDFTYLAKTGNSTSSIRLTGDSFTGKEELTDISELYIAGVKPLAYGDKINFQLLNPLKTEVGQTSAEAAVQFTYLGTSAVTVRIPLSSKTSFATRNECDNIVLTNNAKCSVFFTHTPAIDGTDSEIFKITAVADDTPGTSGKSIQLTVEGKSEKPTETPELKINFATDENGTFPGEVSLGTLSADKILTVENTTDSKVYFRAVATSDAFDVTNGTCNGVLEPKATCTLKAKFAPSKVGADSAYVRVIAGTKAAFTKLTGTGVKSEVTDLPGITITPAALTFPLTEITAQSATKRIVIKATDTTNVKYSVAQSVPVAQSQIFRTVTSCVPGTFLKKDDTCTIDVTYVPSKETDNETILTINFTDNATPATVKQKEIKLTATAVAKNETNLETPIPGVTVSTKRHTFPDTAVGFTSSAFILTLKNNGDKDVTNIQSTSTDLINFSIFNDASVQNACLPTVPLIAGGECNIAYRFTARSTPVRTAYLSIWADGVEPDNQIVELKGRGSLFNKYLNFGFVAKADPAKVISMAYVNDTKAAQEIENITITSYEATWNFEGVNESTDKFVKERFVQTPLTGDKIPFTLVSSDCAVAGGTKKLASQETCLIRLQFDPAKAEDNKHYFARVSLMKGEKVLRSTKTGDDKDRLVGQFHATASTANRSIMFFPPDSDIDEATMDFSNQAHVDAVTAVMGEKYYIYGGLTSEVTGEPVDPWDKDANVTKLRVYDAARNMWKTLKPSGNSPLNDIQGYVTHAIPTAAVVDSRLYLFGGALRKNNSRETDQTNNIYVYDPANVTESGDGAWSKLTVAGNAPVKRQGAAAASVNGYLFIFGGYTDDGTKVLNDFYVIDLRNPNATLTWNKISDNGAAGVAEKTKPSARSNAAVTTFNSKIYIHGGDVDNSTTLTGTPIGEGNDLWEYTPKFNKEGKFEATGTWKQIYTGTNIGGVADDNADPLRPSVRIKHTMSVVDGKLIIAGQGFQWRDAAVGDYKKPYFQVNPDITDNETANDPAKIFTKLDVLETDMTKLGRIQTSGGTAGEIGVNSKGKAIAGHYSSAVEGVFWFFNVKIMGILMDRR